MGQAASAAGQRKLGAPVANNFGAETLAPLLRLEPAAQPGAGDIVAAPSSSARRDFQAAVGTAGEPNNEQMKNLFQRASRDFAEAANYAHVSFLSLASSGVFAWPCSLVP